MAKGLDWAFRLLDKMSGPARGMGQSIAALDRSLGGLQKSVGGLEVLMGSKMSKAAGHVGRGAASIGRSSQVAAPALGVFVGEAMIKATSMAVELAGAGARYAAEMAAFKSNTLFAFKYITGSQKGALETWDTADALARSLGTKTSTVAESMRELMAGGFTQRQALDVTAAIGDVKAMNPKADVGAISQQLAQMKGAGRVLAEDLKPLLNAGINDDIFYQVLREKTGTKNQADMKKMLEAGKVSADVGMAAILETVNRMGGGKGLGTVAADKAKTTVGGAFENMQAQWERLVMSIDSSPLGATLSRIANSLANVFDPKQEGGQKMLAVFGRLAGAVGMLLEKAIPLVGAFAGGFGEGASDAIEALGVVFKGMNLDSMAGLEKVLKAVGAGLAFFIAGLALTAAVAGAAVVGIGFALTWLVNGVMWVGGAIDRAVTAVWGGFVKLVQGIGGFIGGVASAAWGIGVAIFDGIGNGLTAAWDALVAKLSGLVSLLPQTVRSILGIQSPSRVMMQLGVHTGEGFTAGLDASMSDVAGSFSALASPAAAAPAGRGAGSTFAVTIHVDASGAGKEGAEAVGDAVERAVYRVFETLGVSSGGLAPA
jgi:tape measure domain-containing protein